VAQLADRLRGSGGGALRFWWRRIARIWPLQVVVLAVFVALAGVLAATGRNTDAYPGPNCRCTCCWCRTGG
jgi:peptidoglycan/LPS O-acetylase OafA/YrhL